MHTHALENIKMDFMAHEKTQSCSLYNACGLCLLRVKREFEKQEKAKDADQSFNVNNKFSF